VGRAVEGENGNHLLEALRLSSRFPGIDPYIEGQLWADFHNRFIVALSDDILGKLDPRYVALIEERVYIEHALEQPATHIRPDIALAASVQDSAGPIPAAVSTAPVVVPLLMPDRERETFLELRLRGSRELVTVIEILSPANKRLGSEGRREYLAKRAIVHQSSVHLVEIDLLRGGARLPMGQALPPAYSHVIVSHAERRPLCDVWPVALRAPLPTIQIPLSAGDPDVSVDLQAVFNVLFERAHYANAIDYGLSLDPPVDDADGTWVAEVVGTIAPR